MVSLLFLQGCRTESLSPAEETTLAPSISKLDTAGMYRMKDVPLFKDYLKTVFMENTFKSDVYTGLLDNDRLVDVISRNNRVTYSTLVNKGNSVFEILVYTPQYKDPFFVTEYIPDHETSYLNLPVFSGTVNYKTQKGETLGSLYFKNGRPVMGASSSKGVTCQTVITTPVSCIEGLHFPGQPCAYTGTTNAAYYETQIIRGGCRTEQFPPMGGDYGGGGGATNPAYHLPAPDALNYMLSQIGMPNLSSSQYTFVQGNNPIAQRLRTYFFTNQTVNGAKFLYWGIDFLKQNPNVLWAQFEDLFITNTPSGFYEKLVLEDPQTILDYETFTSPNLKMRKIDQLKYPKFTTIIKNLKSEIENNPATLNRIVELTGLTQSQVLGSLTFGQGPTIRLVPNLTGPSGPNYGNFNPKEPTYLNINLNFVLGLEQASLSSTVHATAFLLAVTILHEFIHFGNYISGYDTNGNEMGNLFEIATYGIIITHHNAGYYLIQLK